MYWLGKKVLRNAVWYAVIAYAVECDLLKP